MKNKKTGSTIWVLVLLVAVCCGSFIAVRSLNSRTDKASPVVVSMGGSQTSVFSTTQFIAPATTTTTLPTTTEKPSEADEQTTTKINQFTTFPGAAQTTQTTVAETEASQGFGNFTLPGNITLPSAGSDPSEIVEKAAVFSDGFLSFQYNADEKYYFTVSDPWQRNFGFNELYDLGASFLVFYYDTLRCKFRYDNKDWMIQMWKGQYGFVFLGGEIGIYTKPIDRKVEHYDAANDDETLYMSMSFYRKGEEKFTRKYDKYWWCTGFVPGQLDNFSDRTELSIRAKITMKDQKMLKAFCASLEKNDMYKNENYTTNKLDVYISW